MKKPTTTSLAKEVLAFAEAATPAAEKRKFFAPAGYRRLTVNLPEDLHKKLRLRAVNEDCTATDVVERLLKKELG